MTSARGRPLCLDDPRQSMQMRLPDSEWSAMCLLLTNSFDEFIGCAQCGKRGVVLHKCAVCRAAVYCGKAYLPDPTPPLVHVGGCLLHGGLHNLKDQD